MKKEEEINKNYQSLNTEFSKARDTLIESAKSEVSAKFKTIEELSHQVKQVGDKFTQISAI